MTAVLLLGGVRSTRRIPRLSELGEQRALVSPHDGRPGLETLTSDRSQALMQLSHDVEHVDIDSSEPIADRALA